MKYNSLTVCRDNYKEEYEFREAINTAVNLLLDAEYIMTIRYDDKGLGIVVIEYNHADRNYGCAYPCWLNPEDEVIKIDSDDGDRYA